MAKNDKIEETDESIERSFLKHVADTITNVALEEEDMNHAKFSIAEAWRGLSDRKRKKYAQTLYAKLHRMEAVTQSLVGEFDIMSVHDRV